MSSTAAPRSRYGLFRCWTTRRIFATRNPRRPNRLGLTVVRLCK
ncbi:TrmO family methyltransferase domain-containing protein [Cumulibacter soli]